MGGTKRGAGSGSAVEGAGAANGEQTRLMALHRSRCWEWTPSAVVAISGCPGAPLAAVGYETGDLELWDLSHMTCIHRIPGDGVEVTALAWAKDSLDGTWRTFCAALDGSLSEVLWKQSQLVASTDSGAGAIWSMAAQPAASVAPGFAHPIAAACDDGSVRLFNVEAGEPGAHYERTLAWLQGRALAVSWHPSGTALVAGGVDGCIHAIDLASGNETLRITASAVTTRPVCVWRLAVLADGTIASGDSDGAVQLWDGRFGAQLHRFVHHSADILALAAAPDGESIFASGVDPRVALFRRTGGSSTGSSSKASASGSAPPASASAAHWVYTHYKRPHTHDVRALDLVPLGSGRYVLLSGGVDAQLIAYPVTSFLNEHPVRLTKCPQRPLVQLALGGTDTAAAARVADTPAAKRGTARFANGHAVQQLPAPRMLCAHNDTLDVWQLARASSSAGASTSAAHEAGARRGGAANAHAAAAGLQEGDALELTAAPRHLARITCGAGRVGAAAVSPRGGFVACVSSSTGAVRLYQLTASSEGALDLEPGQELSVARVKLVGSTTTTSSGAQPTAVALTDSILVLGFSDGALFAYALPGTPAAVAALQTDASLVSPGSSVGSCAPFIARLPPRDSSQAVHAGVHAQRGSSGQGASSSDAASSWRNFAPAISLLSPSPDGTLVAAAGCSGVSLVRLPGSGGEGAGSSGMSYAGKLLRSGHDAPVTCVAFSADSTQLAATLASGHLVLYDTATARPTSWSLEHDKGVAACLARLPGAPAGVSFSPEHGSSQLLVWSHGGFCALDTSLPPATSGEDGRESKRKRGRARPDHAPANSGGTGVAGPVADVSAAAGVEHGNSSSRKASLGKGANGRTMLLADPAAFLGHLSAGEAVLLEKPWEEVTAAFRPPLYKHRYGA